MVWGLTYVLGSLIMVESLYGGRVHVWRKGPEGMPAMVAESHFLSITFLSRIVTFVGYKLACR